MPYAFDRQSVKSLLKEFVIAWNEADAQKFDGLLEEDAAFADAQKRRFQGRAKVVKALVSTAKSGELRVVKVEFKAFHPDIVLCDLSYTQGENSANGTLYLVATCGPDRWAIEWVRFLPRDPVA